MKPSEIRKAVHDAYKAVKAAHSKVVDADAAVAVYWKRKAEVGPQPNWISGALRAQSSAAADLAHILELWASDELRDGMKDSSGDQHG